MIDPMTSLAFSVYSNKGVYALLIGSGISRSAGILTGWDITLDLIRSVAKIQKEDCGEKADDWYRSKFNKEPSYSDIFDLLSKTSHERRNILKKYFEHDELNPEDPPKKPTVAHVAIAELVKLGFIRVIITTNFDRLFESALSELGVSVTPIYSEDQIKGAAPLAHSGPVLIKLHGDYLDTRLKNTPEELDNYDDNTNKLLDRIFDEFGLIVCGWSADWDTALCRALERSPSRRFPIYWSAMNQLNGKALQLCESKKASIINGLDANNFFTKLSDAVKSLDEITAEHPATLQIAKNTIKRMLADPNAKIKIHDLLSREASELSLFFSSSDFSVNYQEKDVNFYINQIKGRIEKYLNKSNIFLNYIALVSYWWHEGSFPSLKNAISIISDLRIESVYIDSLNRLRLFPALVSIYSIGISAIFTNGLECFLRLLLDIKSRFPSGIEKDIFEIVFNDNVMGVEVFSRSYGCRKRGINFSVFLRDNLRPIFADLIRVDNDFELCFDQLEYTLGLVCSYRNYKSGDEAPGPAGKFLLNLYENNFIGKKVEKELNQLRFEHPFIKSGFFGRMDQVGTPFSNAQQAIRCYNSYLSKIYEQKVYDLE